MATRKKKAKWLVKLLKVIVVVYLLLILYQLSLPRFARNTLDTLKYVRMLKEKGIAVYFEVEKINTMKDGEFLMTILSSVAQQEVENTSAYVKKGLKMKMKRGELVTIKKIMWLLRSFVRGHEG